MQAEPTGGASGGEPGLSREIHADEVGRGDGLLLVAGTAFSGATWPPELVERLAVRYRVITFDHRGTGRTPATEGPYSTQLFATDALAVLDRLGIERCTVLGHSMGGRVAQWMALLAPDRVERLILAASGPGRYRDDRPPADGIPLPVALALEAKGYERFIGDHIRATFFTPEAAWSPAADWLVSAYWDSRPDLENYLKHVIARQQHRTTDRLHEIRRPTLVVVGDRDTHAGGTGSHVEQSKFLAANLPDAELVLLPGVSHGYFWEATERSAEAVLDWLQARR